MTNADYFQELYGTCDQGFISVWHMKTKGTEWFPAKNWDEAASYMLRAANDDDVYFGWGTHGAALPGKRGSSDTVIGFPGLMMDVDLQQEEDGIHTETRLPTSSEEGLHFLAEIGFPPPTLVRHSGNGIYPDWLFEEFFYFGSPEGRKSFQELSSRFQRVVLQAALKLYEWKLDNVGDLARMTRMPGTKNHKTEPAKDVLLTDWGCGSRYSLAELEEAVERLERKYLIQEKRSVAPRSQVKRAQRTDIANDDRHPEFESIAAGCSWVAGCVDRSERLTEPEWYSLAGIVGRCNEGSGVFHELSSADPRYDEQETDEKLLHALEAAGPRTCVNIAQELGAEECAECPLNGKLTSPIQLGYAAPVVANLLSSFVLDVTMDRYVELRNGFSMHSRAFTNWMRDRLSNAHVELTSNKFMRKVLGSRYLPGKRERFPDLHGATMLNTWRKGGVEPEEGREPSVILEHLEFLFPDEKEQSHFLNCFANAVQRPEAKLKHAMLIIGRQGTGKSFLAALVERIFGEGNVKTVGTDVLKSQWTANLVDCQALIIEELMTEGRREVYNRMKQWITDETVEADEKHMTIRTASTPRLVLGLSNHADPVSLEASDRRFWVSKSDAAPRDSDYYRRLFTEGLDEAGAFVAYLLRRDLSGFSAEAPPPMTEAKRDMIQSSRPRVEQVLRAAFDEEHPLFIGDLIRFDSVRNFLETHPALVRATDNQIREALRALGAQPLRQVRINQARPYVWALRNKDYWMNATADDIRRELNGELAAAS